MLLSVIFTIINPCTYLGGAPCINLKNKTLSYLIIKKTPVFVSNHQKGGD
jgi:hypothetical protein